MPQDCERYKKCTRRCGYRFSCRMLRHLLHPGKAFETIRLGRSSKLRHSRSHEYNFFYICALDVTDLPFRRSSRIPAREADNSTSRISPIEAKRMEGKHREVVNYMKATLFACGDSYNSTTRTSIHATSSQVSRIDGGLTVWSWPAVSFPQNETR
jgi:hypothetical protein